MGFLNPSEDDDYRISQMGGTSEVPAAGAFQGLLTAVPKGLTSASMKLGSLASSIGDGLRASMLGGAYQSDMGGDVLSQPPYLQAPDLHDPSQRLPGFAGELQAGGQAAIDKAHAAVQVAADWSATGSDPRQTGVVGRIAGQTAEGVSIGLAGGAVAGPWGAATLLGSTYGHSAYLEAKQNGLDDKTAMEQAGIVGGFSAASAFLPMKFGNSLAASIVGGGAANIGLGMAQRFATSTVLQSNGYAGMASQYRVFDGEAIAADAILGHAFGALGHAMGTHANPADVDAAAAVATEEHYNRSAPGVPTDPDVANAHAQTMADALRSMAEGDLPDVQPEVAQRIVDGVIPDPIHENAQALREAGLDDIPGFEAALADVPRQELPPESIPHYGASTTSDFMDIVGEAFGVGLIKAALGGHDGPVQRTELAPELRAPERAPDAANVMLDDFHQATLDHLVHNYGDAPFGGDYSLGIPEHDNFGRPITFKQAAALMQYRRNEAENFAALHDVVAACAARNGFGP